LELIQQKSPNFGLCASAKVKNCTFLYLILKKTLLSLRKSFFLAHLGQIWLHGGPKTSKTVFFAVISGVKGLTTVYNKRFIHAASQITQTNHRTVVDSQPIPMRFTESPGVLCGF